MVTKTLTALVLAGLVLTKSATADQLKETFWGDLVSPYANIRMVGANVLGNGALINDNIVFQGEVGVDTKRFNANTWTNYDPVTGKFTEVDFQVNFPWSSKWIRANGQVGYITSPTSSFPPIIMPKLTIGTNGLPEYVPNFSITGLQMFAEGSYPGQMYTTDITETIPLGDQTTLVLNALARYQDRFVQKKDEKDMRGFSHLRGRAEINHNLTPRLNMALGVEHQQNINKKYQDKIPNKTWAYFSAKWRF
jgi:hypothetical protein